MTNRLYPACLGQGHRRAAQVSVLYFAGCPNWQEAGRRLRSGLAVLGPTGTPASFVPVQGDADTAAVVYAEIGSRAAHANRAGTTSSHEPEPSCRSEAAIHR
jgi:hypothetical protein